MQYNLMLCVASFRTEALRLEHALADADSTVYGQLLRQCAQEKSLSQGKLIHAHILRSTYSRQTYLKNLLVQMYAKCGSLAEARSVFDTIQRRNNHSWNIMIGAYAQNGHTDEALALFRKVFGCMEGDALKICFVNVLGALVSEEDLRTGTELHQLITDRNLLENDTILSTALLSMYGRCGGVSEAERLFDGMQRNGVVPWNAMLAAYAQTGQWWSCLALFRHMDLEGIPSDHVTYATVVDACGDAGDISESRRVHQRIQALGLDRNDVPTGNSLINMYGKCHRPEESRAVFERMPVKNLITWTALISAYAESESEEHSSKALQVFHDMDLECSARPNETTFTRLIIACSVPSSSGRKLAGVKAVHSRIVETGVFANNVFLATSVINMYSKLGRVEEALDAFRAIPSKDSVAWNSIIAALQSHGRIHEAIALFRRMDQEGVRATEGTFASVLSAVSSINTADKGLELGRMFHLGKQVHARIVQTGLDYRASLLGNALVHMYGRFGDLVRAQETFDNMRLRNITCWTALIEAYAQHGQGKQTLKWFQEMHLAGVEPDKITFVGLLFACSHSGLLEPAKNYFVSMREDHGIEPIQEHYQCLVDLLGRVGQLERAKELIQTMPFHPNSLAWRTLATAG